MERLFYIIILLCASSEFSFAQWGIGKFEAGGAYYILQYRANVRAEPSLDSPVVGVLSFGNRVELLERRGTSDVINGYHEYWYKIKYGNVIGYTFGGNLARQMFVADIENNGINSYFFYRSRWNYFSGQDARRDIFIFVNNQRVNTTMLRTYSSDYKLAEPYFGWCEFEEQNDHVLMKISLWGNVSRDGSNYAFRNIYKIDSNGTIEFVDWEIGNIRGRDYRNTRTTESELHRPPPDDRRIWEWYTLEAYERGLYKDTQIIEGIIISDDGQLWLKTWYSGK